MSIYTDQIADMVHEQSRLLEKYTAELRTCPEGRLIRSRNHGKDCYYHATSTGGSGRDARKAVDNDPDMIRRLARKEYLQRAVRVLEKNVQVLNKVSGSLGDMDLDALLGSMSKGYRDLPQDYFFRNGEYDYGIYTAGNMEEILARHRAWAAEPYEMSDYKPEGRRFMTSAGIKVRSKSEQHIVEQLVNYGVPFRYEQVINVGDWAYSADFTFEGYTGDLFYWEHAGMMDVEYYRDSHMRKMSVLESVDIVPWRNLIVTYDVDGVINVPMIKSVIEKEVIPRL